MKIDIRDNISEEIALELVLDVVKKGRVSQGEHGKMYYCWVTIFNVDGIEYAVSVRQYRKIDCFVVYKYRRNENITLATKERVVQYD